MNLTTCVPQFDHSAHSHHYHNNCVYFLLHSDYPESRVIKDSNDVDMGVAGSVSLLQNITLSTQPIGGFDWHADKAGLCVCTSYDQALRVLIVTKLARL